MTQTPEQHLIDKTTRRHQDLIRRAGLERSHPDYLSKNESGPVLSGILDLKDESRHVHFGLNNDGRDDQAEKLPPANLHLLLQRRLKEQRDEWESLLSGLKQKQANGLLMTREEKGVLTAGPPGYHSEVYALDVALKAREARTGIDVTSRDLSDFLLHNISLKGKQAGGVPYRCFNCRPLTEGVSLTSLLEASER